MIEPTIGLQSLVLLPNIKRRFINLRKSAFYVEGNGGDKKVKGLGFPLTPCFSWRAMGDSNARPLVPETNALST